MFCRYAIKVVRPFVNMTIVMIDTVSLCGNTLADDETSAPDGNINPDHESAQLHFIKDQLKHNKYLKLCLYLLIIEMTFVVC